MTDHPYAEQYEKVPIEVRVRHDLSDETLTSLIDIWIKADLLPPDDGQLAELGRCAQWLSQAFGLDAEILVKQLANTISRSQRDPQGVRW